ncbi:hypothetical protein EPO05_05860 [Patescibacteria group bacterium]|nr:MAG: hypothetical protein EPO05_05860 [Patescibacteria group bacterium]
MLKDPKMSGVPKTQSWRDWPMREVNIEMKGSVEMIESERGYPWREQLDKKEGKFLELAGPTKHAENDILDFSKYRDNTICTNLTSREGIDKVVDARATEFPDDAFQAIFVSSFRIPDEDRKHVLPDPGEPDLENDEQMAEVAKETWRILAPGGLLVWLRIENENEFIAIEKAGFIPIYIKDFCYQAHAGRHRYQVVFLKEAKK